MQSVTPTWLRQVATALSTRYNVQVREGKGWAIDLEKNVMYYKPDHLLALDRDTCLGILLHELGHLHFTTNDWTETSSLYKDKNLKGICFNAVNAFEDVRINEKMSQSYGGSRELIDAMNELLGGDGVRNFMLMSKDIKEQGRNRSNYSSPDWHEIFYISMAQLLNQFPKSYAPTEWYDQEKMRICNEITDKYLELDLSSTDNTQAIADFVKDEVFPRIQQYLPQSGKNPVEEGEGESGGTTKSDSEAEENSEQSDSSSNGDTDNEGTEETENEPNAGTSEASQENAETETDESEAQDEQASSGNGEGEATGEDSEAEKESESADEFNEDAWKKEVEEKIQNAIKRGRVNPDETHKTQPFGENGRGVGGREQRIHPNCNVQKFDDESITLQMKFRNKFEAVFRDNSYARAIPNQKSGRLNKRVLYKHRVNNPRLFNKKTEVSKKSYGVAFAMDLSSSMHQRQIEGSMKAMLAFSKTLEKLQIPFGIGFFSHRSAIGKHFASKKVTNKYLAQQASTVTGGGTRPSGVLDTLFAKELAQQRVEQKIGIILTDGMWDSRDIESLRKLKKNNPTMHLYLVTLSMHPMYINDLTEMLTGTATLLNSDNADGVVEEYLKIAKKHLL